MITFLIILIGLFVIFLINNEIISLAKRNNPKKTAQEVENSLSKKTSTIAISGLFLIFFSVVYLNFFHKTDEELRSEKYKILMDIKEKKEQKEILDKVEARKNRPVSEKLDDLYRDMFLNTDENITTAMWFNSFDALSDAAIKSDYKKRFLKTKDSLEKNIAFDQKKRSSLDRKQFAIDFRNKLLDRNLNIKVEVSGKDNKKIVLTYVLFDEVWFRKFETEGYFDEIHSYGFNRIELKNGYDYGQGVKYDD